eukprot:CAMPEP_0117418776 /NCGR_PEP_ID=MMETSP0758-20121206/489_1 /TAXON_ID=63605 /ORGANISM="Percolomonas cosmopolitus, Strain AE-1 (ATCC 50343)" /LENGTH=605 /DNA_ID=CAMNT_0005199481 /DNA_START=475 /DNA_END=2289 /DNA_ORIENTATION=-
MDPLMFKNQKQKQLSPLLQREEGFTNQLTRPANIEQLGTERITDEEQYYDDQQQGGKYIPSLEEVEVLLKDLEVMTEKERSKNHITKEQYESRKETEAPSMFRTYLGEGEVIDYHTHINTQFFTKQIGMMRKAVSYSDTVKPIDYTLFIRKGHQMVTDEKDPVATAEMIAEYKRVEDDKKQAILDRIGEVSHRQAKIQKHDYLKGHTNPKYLQTRNWEKLSMRNVVFMKNLLKVESTFQHTTNTKKRKANVVKRNKMIRKVLDIYRYELMNLPEFIRRQQIEYLQLLPVKELKIILNANNNQFPKGKEEESEALKGSTKVLSGRKGYANVSEKIYNDVDFLTTTKDNDLPSTRREESPRVPFKKYLKTPYSTGSVIHKRKAPKKFKTSMTPFQLQCLAKDMAKIERAQSCPLPGIPNKDNNVNNPFMKRNFKVRNPKLFDTAEARMVCHDGMRDAVHSETVLLQKAQPSLSLSSTKPLCPFKDQFVPKTSEPISFFRKEEEHDEDYQDFVEEDYLDADTMSSSIPKRMHPSPTNQQQALTFLTQQQPSMLTSHQFSLRSPQPGDNDEISHPLAQSYILPTLSNGTPVDSSPIIFSKKKKRKKKKR